MNALAAEALGTALQLAVVIGSGIMGERLAGGNVASWSAPGAAEEAANPTPNWPPGSPP